MDRRSKHSIRISTTLSLIMGSLVASCALSPRPIESARHLTSAEASPAESSAIPEVIPIAPKPPRPLAHAARQPVFSVVVHNVPVRDLLFALARDAKVNVDLHPEVSGLVSVNAYNQTFSQILSRLTRQASIRVEHDHGTILIVPDKPFMRNYTIDYVNMSRILKSEVSLSTAIGTTGGSVNGAGSSNAQGNSSSTRLNNVSEHQLWKTLVENIKEILKEEELRSPVNVTPPIVPAIHPGTTTPTAGASIPAVLPVAVSAQPQEALGGRVIANPETGVVAVWGSSRQHARVKAFVDQVLNQAQRQVLIEATIVEVVLSDNFQMGVDWSRLTQGTGLGSGLSFLQNRAPDSTPFATLTYRDNPHNFAATLNLLETFGRTRVLSSPKIIALNNQTALLKVVDEKVYFATQVKITEATTTTPERRDYTSDIKTVPVGVVMNVTPQISEDDQVSLNIRPTISRITGYKADPVPQLLGANFQNLVPEIQVRELESMLKVGNGQVVILGGLMQDTLEQNRNGVPGLSSLPGIGDLFKQKNDTGGKSELVIFLRPTVVKRNSLESDLAEARRMLPDSHFMEQDNLDTMGAGPVHPIWPVSSVTSGGGQ